MGQIRVPKSRIEEALDSIIDYDLWEAQRHIQEVELQSIQNIADKFAHL